MNTLWEPYNGCFQVKYLWARIKFKDGKKIIHKTRKMVAVNPKSKFKKCLAQANLKINDKVLIKE